MVVGIWVVFDAELSPPVGDLDDGVPGKLEDFCLVAVDGDAAEWCANEDESVVFILWCVCVRVEFGLTLKHCSSRLLAAVSFILGLLIDLSFHNSHTKNELWTHCSSRVMMLKVNEISTTINHDQSNFGFGQILNWLLDVHHHLHISPPHTYTHAHTHTHTHTHRLPQPPRPGMQFWTMAPTTATSITSLSERRSTPASLASRRTPITQSAHSTAVQTATSIEVKYGQSVWIIQVVWLWPLHVWFYVIFDRNYQLYNLI